VSHNQVPPKSGKKIGLAGQLSATADEDDSQIQVGDTKGVMIDVEGSPASNAPRTEAAETALRDEIPANETRSPSGKIATPPPEKESNNVESIKRSPGNAVADGDSEAETLIESPEKRKLNIVESAPRLQPLSEDAQDSEGENELTSSQSSRSRSRKRKRSDDESKDDSHRPSSRRSSPLSSPILDAPSTNESETSHSFRNTKHHKQPEDRRLDALDKDSKETDGKQHTGKPAGLKIQKRRKSEVEEDHARHSRRRQSPDAGGTERRETRSATFPRQDTPEPSLSPRPGRDHKRIASVQSVQTLASHKTRRIPAPLNTRRNHSSDRSSDASNSPAPSRPHLQKFTSNDYDATSPAKVMAKKLRDRHGRTFLAQACTDDKLDRVKQVYEERPQDLNIADNAGNTPLQIAALPGHIEIVEFLLEKHCEVNTRNIERDTPLIDAVENGHVEVVKLLLDHGADPKLGNSVGKKPIELVDNDDDEIRKLLIDAKYKTVNRRQSEDQAPSTHAREGSSRAASAASPRDSPPVHGPKSPPPLQLSRRRAREQTRNDLLWQANTPENLTKLAGKGDTEGVVNILNILNKASPEALIAACKGGHDEVLQLLIAMGNPDPDPEPVLSTDQRRGYNTPMLAAIGEGNTLSVTLLLQQDGFNPTREFRGRTYYEISKERKGDDWQKEYNLLKSAYNEYSKSHPNHHSPRKTRDVERRSARDSSSPVSKRAKSPSRSQTEPQIRKEGRVTDTKRSDLRDPSGADHSIAVSSDHDRRTPQKSHKTRRSRSDALFLNSEEEVHKKRRLVSRREHMKSSNNPTEKSSGDERAVPLKREKAPESPKRRRSSVAAETPRALDVARIKKRSRRALSDSSPEESRTIKRRMSVDSMKKAKVLQDVDTILQSGQVDEIRRTATPESLVDNDEIDRIRKLQDSERLLREAEERKENERLKKIKEEQDATEKLARQQEEERVKAEQEAQQKAEEERIATERKLAEEAAAKKKADEETLARKREEEERQERMRREAEEKQRRAEERRQRILRENEQRRMEALPKLLCKSAKLLDQNSPEAKSPDFLQKFLPLFTVKTRQIDPYCTSDLADEDWFPGFQAAPLLAAKNLGLEHFTHWEKRKVNDQERLCLWKVARTMLIHGDDQPTALNMSIEQALQLDRETQPKFEAMQPLVWVKVSQTQPPFPIRDTQEGKNG
jgi:Ankyrin repeats (3 copies)